MIIKSENVKMVLTSNISINSIRTTSIRGLCVGAFIACAINPASAVPLSFTDYFGAATGFTKIGNSKVIEKSEVLFTGVAKDAGRLVDAKITTKIKNQTDFAETGKGGFFGNPGFIPNYMPSGDGESADLGFLFYGNGINDTENGITVTFEFFDGTGGMSGTYANVLEVSKLEFAIYDVDGESKIKGSYNDQSEGFRAYQSDGLTGYLLGLSEQALTASHDGDVILFEGPGKNFSESDASGAVILVYENTSAFTLDFASVQKSGVRKNAVFSAFDGDLSLVNVDDFGPTINVSPIPLPSSILMLWCSLGALGFFGWRTKKA